MPLVEHGIVAAGGLGADVMLDLPVELFIRVDTIYAFKVGQEMCRDLSGGRYADQAA